MNYTNFRRYNKEAELPGGDYWKFTELSNEEISNYGIYYYDFNKVLMQITNEELKLKIKDKLSSLILEYGVHHDGISNCLDIFSDDELKIFLKKEFDANVASKLLKKDRLWDVAPDVYQFVCLINKIHDSNFAHDMCMTVLEVIKDYSDKSLLVGVIECFVENKELYEKLIIQYYNYLPEEYKNYIRMKNDRSYVYNKSLKFMNDGMRIGIDPRISIAPEIEVDKLYVYQLDLYKQIGLEGHEYSVTTDASVSKGNEIVPFRPFHDTPQDIAIFCALCETMSDIGYYYDEVKGDVAGQINLGLDYLDSKEAILNFYEIYGNCEELLYYISSEEGQLFRQSIYGSSRIKPLSEIVGVREIDEELSRQDVIDLFGKDYDSGTAIKGLKQKKNSVCLRGSSERDYRLEFRIPNGGCNYKTWIDNIRLYGKMLERAKQLADLSKKDYLTAEEENLLRIKIELQDKRMSFEEKLVLLMDLLFEDESLKKIYYDRYKTTIKKISETHTLNYVDAYDSSEPGFDEVEFIDSYHSRLDPNYDGEGLVVTYDPETEIMTSNRRK